MNKTITAIICDDEPRLAEDLRDQLAAVWPDLKVVGLGHSGGEALTLTAEHDPDIAFLDIRMPGLTGIEVARHLVGGESAPRIVFITAFDDHAVTAFEAGAIDYLLKPVKAERLQACVERLKRTLEQSNAAPDEAIIQTLRKIADSTKAERKYLRWLNCGQGQEIDVIATCEVMYFQARDKYTGVITAEKERYIRMPLKELLDQLDPDEFWQVHRSSVIRVAAIERVIKNDSGQMRVRMRGVREEVVVSGAFTGRFKQM